MKGATSFQGKRILIVIRQFFPLAGGAETQALRQAASYIKMGHQALVLTARHARNLPKYDTVSGVPVTRLPAPRVRFLGSIVFLTRLALYLAAHRRQYDAVLVFHLKQSAMVASLVGAILGKRVAISVQGAGRFGDVEALKDATFSSLLLWGCRKAHAFVSGSSDMTDELEAAGIPPSKIHFIPNGVPLEKYGGAADRPALRRSLGIAPEAFVVINVGRHSAVKDLGTLLAAWREFHAARAGSALILVGDGEERPALEKTAEELGISSSVRFEGWRDNVPDYLLAADVFASCSISEGTHLALGEAMAAGLAVAATPVGGARDYVCDGENGILFRVGDSKALLAALRRLAADARLRHRLGKAAAVQARKSLDQDETARKHLQALFPQPAAARPRGKVHIVHVIATLDRGGTERQMAELVTRMDKRVFANEVICLTRSGPTGAILEGGGVPYRILGKRGKGDFLAVSWLVRRLFFQPPDILHTWLFTSNSYGRVAAALSGTGNVVSSERSTDPWKTRLHRTLDRLLASHTARLVANSRCVAGSLEANGIPREKIAVIPNGVDAERFHAIDSTDARFVLGLLSKGPCFGYIGRLAYEKRPEVFLQVVRAVIAEMPEAHALVFGEGPLEETLRTQARRYAGSVTFYGDCPFPELSHASLDCLVLTSQWEGFPNVVLEAMASARPVVAVRIPATEELIEDGKTGILTDDNPESLAGAVLSLLRDPQRAAEMGRLGREKVENLYSMEKMVKEYERLYLQVVKPWPQRGGAA